MHAMLEEMRAASKYRDRATINTKAADSLLMAAVAGQKQNGPQGTFCKLAEERGQPVGFMVGSFDRVYHIADQLTANDIYLFVRQGQPPKHSFRLVGAYIEWAERNPKCIEIMLSWSDALPGAERIADLFGRKGFGRVGEMWERRVDVAAQLEAAL